MKLIHTQYTIYNVQCARAIVSKCEITWDICWFKVSHLQIAWTLFPKPECKCGLMQFSVFILWKIFTLCFCLTFSPIGYAHHRSPFLCSSFNTDYLCAKLNWLVLLFYSRNCNHIFTWNRTENSIKLLISVAQMLHLASDSKRLLFSSMNTATPNYISTEYSSFDFTIIIFTWKILWQFSYSHKWTHTQLASIEIKHLNDLLRFPWNIFKRRITQQNLVTMGHFSLLNCVLNGGDHS